MFHDVKRRMAFTTHNLPSERLKNDFCKFHEAMFHGVKRPYELIFYIQCLKKRDLNEVA
jgi:hypothetical protein